MSGLFNSSVLDVAIGLIFVYLLLAIICTTVNEWISGMLKTRSTMLKAALTQLLDSQATKKGADGGGQGSTNQFLADFNKHPLIAGMMHGGANPSYLSSRTFSTVVMDVATAATEGKITFDQLETGIKALPPGDVRTALLALIQNAHGSLDAAQKAIEAWFNDTMDRISGWYKRNTQIWIIAIAIVVTILSNADTINITRELWTDPVLRAQIIESAKTRAAQPSPSPTAGTQSSSAQSSNAQAQSSSANGGPITDQERQELGELLGWHLTGSGSTLDRIWSQMSFERVLGWILTIIAVSLGAPFWFDVLKKIMNLRSAGKSPSDNPPTPTQAAQQTAPPAAQAGP